MYRLTAPRPLLTIALLTAATILLALAAACRPGPDELNPEPDYGTKARPIRASAIWEEFQGAATSQYANDKYKNKWVWIRADGVRKANNSAAGIDLVTPQSVIIRTPGGITEMEFIFRFPEDTEELGYRRGDTPKILCQVGGTDLLGNKLKFNHCRDESQTEKQSSRPRT